MATRKDCYDLLDSIRDTVMTFPTGHKLRIRYRDLRRGLANAAEEAEHGGNSALLTQGGMDKHMDEIERLRAAIAAAREEE